MASNNNDHVVQYDVVPDGESLAQSPETPTQLHLNITADFTRRPQTLEEFSDDHPLGSATTSVSFFLPLYERSDFHDQHIRASLVFTIDEIMGMLDAVHVLPRRVAAEIARKIQVCCARMAISAPSHGRVLRVIVNVDLFVDELPDEEFIDDDDDEDQE